MAEVELDDSHLPLIARVSELSSADRSRSHPERDALLAAMRRIQGDPAYRARLAVNGYRAYVERWSESAVVPKYLDIVRRAAARRVAEGVRSRGTDRVLGALPTVIPQEVA
jgi:hypothetical protein